VKHPVSGHITYSLSEIKTFRGERERDEMLFSLEREKKPAGEFVFYYI